MNIISKNMKRSEIKTILKKHDIPLPYMWDISLWLVFNTLKTDKIKIIGYGKNAEFEAIYEDNE